MSEVLTIPHDFEAEQAVLGSIIFDNKIVHKIFSILKPNSFHAEQHQQIFSAMIELTRTKQPIDEIILGDQLKSINKLDDIGGYSYLAELVESVPSSGNIVYYARIIQEHALIRDLISTTTDIGRKSRDPQQNISDLLREADAKIREIASARSGAEVVHIKDVLLQNFNEVEELSKSDREFVGVSTGFSKLDRITCGMLPADYIILAARPSMGKTALALNIAKHAALVDPIPGGVYISTLETKNRKLAKRMLANVGNISSYFLKTGKVPKSQPDAWDRLAKATDTLSAADIYFNDRSKNIDDICYSVESTHMRVKDGLKLFITDYIQIAEGMDRKSREREIAYISKRLNDLSNDLNLPVLALSQLNRLLESRSDKRPQTSDLRDSGSIEQDADIILFLYRDDVYKLKDNPQYVTTGIAELNVDKNRDGPTGMIELLFEGKYTRFVDKP
jgi:replicative DNA helicase